MIIDDLLARTDIMMGKSNDHSSVHYAEACAGFGAVRLAGLVNDYPSIIKLSERYKKVIDAGVVNTANYVDANVYGILPLELYIQTKEDIFLNQGLFLADAQWKNPLSNGLTNQTRYWVDDIWMIGSLQTQAFRATGKDVYLDRAALEIDSYIQKLQQPR
jgi:unsaturated rhamnogalacturonyl hydrolase